MGPVNGALVAGLRLPSIVVTLATMVIWREALRWLRQGEFVNLPDTFPMVRLEPALRSGPADRALRFCFWSRWQLR